MPCRAYNIIKFATTMLSVSSDGYIRLLHDQLHALKPVHLVSGLDDDSPPELHCGTAAGAITGYTEWICPIDASGAAITIGWDWRMLGSGEGLNLERISDPRSNLMLQDNSKIDYGQINTLVEVCTFVDNLSWQNVTLDYLAKRYQMACPNLG